ncbi:hypothetical protein [Rhodoferax sp.]|uniref:hypothetical protein n=1 Tax=Rhodoferax sp. TaxID=50421 RepID=UPI0027175EBC|nr:hypothetical protein [Rhodoferax sp.]MDO8319720.1 hypothetical protein [Rhodoferax sp.]MDP2677192.1 hypothetical protein [Rhodoferax sp.]
MTSEKLTAAQQLHAQEQRDESQRYAFLLDWSTRLGVLALLLAFASYVFGILPPHVPLDQLPSLWNLPVDSYLQRTATPAGWGWLALAFHGDLSNLVGIGLLAGSSIAPLLGLMLLYAKRKDWVYAVICAVIFAVLLLAASGLLTGGH